MSTVMYPELAECKRVLYFDYVSGVQILSTLGLDARPKEAVGGMVLEVESKIVRKISYLLEKKVMKMEDVEFILKEGQSLEDIDEEAVQLVWEQSLEELPVTLSEGQLRRYIDRYTQNVIPWLHDQRNVEYVLDKIEHVKDYLVKKLPHLKFYADAGPALYACHGNVVYVTEKMQAAIVFADTSKEKPTFLYLAYGLEPAPNGRLTRKIDSPPRWRMTQEQILKLQEASKEERLRQLSMYN